MIYVTIRHKVKDFHKWKSLFDEHNVVRKAMGSLGGQIFKSIQNPNDITIIMKWDNIENAHKFMNLPDLKETMEKAGVMEKPEVHFLDEVDMVEN